MLIHAGDIVHAPALQLADPDVAISFDIDMNTARDTRRSFWKKSTPTARCSPAGTSCRPRSTAEADGMGFKLVPGVD